MARDGPCGQCRVEVSQREMFVSDAEETAIVVAGFVVAGLLIALIVWAAIANDRRWSAFKLEHHCVVEGHISSSNGYGTDFNGKFVMTTIPGKVLWRCDDGQIHGRDE